MITRELLTNAKAEIERRIELRLQEEAGRIPANFLASGQYLDHPDFEQRGLYGTAAAIRVLAGRATSDPHVAEQVGKLLSYVINRSQAERAAVSPAVYRDLIARRIRLQRSDVFRMADVGFAVAHVSPAVPQRTEALTLVQRTLSEARNQPRGFAVGAEGGETNPLATAHALRCLAANNLPTEEEDWRYLREYLQSGDDVYIRCFVLYVLSIYDTHAERKILQSSYKALFDLLSREFNAQTEANHEYTRYGAQDYVRIPWQIYLVQACAKLYPLTRFNNFAIQRKITSVATQISSATGYRYNASGKYLSTRTYACAWQAFTELVDFNLTAPMPRLVARSVTGGTRLLSSRVSNAVLYTLMIAVAVISLVFWLRSKTHSIGDLAPNLLTELLLVLLVGASVRVRRNKLSSSLASVNEPRAYHGQKAGLGYSLT